MEVTDPNDLSRFVTALREIDWSQEPTPENVVDMPAIEINQELVDNERQSHDYAFYWSNDAIVGPGRVYEADVTTLRSLVLEATGLDSEFTILDSVVTRL